MKKNAFFLICFFLGLALKLPSVFYNGMGDLITFSKWGKEVLEKGLMCAYRGTYFPIQYQIFEFAEYMTAKFHFYPNNFISFKIINLCFDIGNFILLGKILRKYLFNINYALLYWLLPWFINVLWLGYIDFHFTFFILLFILMYRHDEKNVFRIIIYGIPLAFAFLMKPQALILIFLAAIYHLVEFYRKKSFKGMLIFLPSIALFILYAWIIGYWYLPLTYLSVSSAMPILTGNMLNLWYPVAYFLKQPNDLIWSIPDTIISIFHLPILRIVAVFCVLSASIAYIIKLKYSKYDLLFIFTFGSLIVPFIMTSAHENHLFLGTVLLCLCIPVYSDKRFTVYSLLLICIQQINIFFLYQIGNNKLSVFDIPLYYSYRLGLILSFASCFLFVAILSFMFRKCSVKYA